MSTDWDTPANWDVNSVPGSGDDVIIPDCTGLPNCPVIDASTTATTKKLTIDADGSLIIQMTGSITIDDNIVLEGSIDVNSGATFTADKALTVGATNNGATFTNSGTALIDGEIVMDGSLVINSGATFTAGDAVTIGNSNDDATFTNNGTVSITKNLTAVGGSGVLYDGPFITNTGDMAVLGDLTLGNDDGPGTLTNSGTMSFDNSHVHGAIINSGTMEFTTELFLHGAVLEGGGNIDTPSVKMDEKGGRIADIADQSVYSGTSACSGNGADDIGVKYNGSTFQNLMDAENAPTDGSKYIFSDPGNFNACSESAASALPIELISFSGQFKNEKTSLSWSTATEVNNDHFEIESSKDGLSFSKIGDVNGNGTTNEVMKYSFVDENPSGFENYYRLKQVDYDGQFEVFNTIMVLSVGSSGIKIYPNPTSSNSRLVVQVNNSLESNLVSVELADLSGRILQKKLGYSSSFEFSTAHLTKGTYLVRVSMNSIVQTSKLLVD